MSGVYPTNITNEEGPSLHGAFPYISLMFKLITTLIIILMASLVCVTIKKTKRLHRPHNILVANVMIADVMLALWSFIPAGIAISGAAIGADLTHCGLFNFAYHPVIAYHATFVMISIDKVIAITFPLRYKGLVTHRVVAGSICISWLFAVFASIHTFFVRQNAKLPKYGICDFITKDFLRVILTYAIPIFTEALTTTTLNVYLAYQVYQVHRQIQKETRLSGATSQVEALQQKRRKIRQHMKPIFTLLIILLGNSLISLVFISIYIPGQFLVTNSVYHNIMEYVVRPNIIYCSPLLHPIVYGIHFKQIREPMMKLVLHWYNRCRQATAVVTPQA